MDRKDGQKRSSATRHRLLPSWVAMGAVRSAIDKAVELECRAGGYHRHQRAIVLRPHDRKGIHTCQVGSLNATRESGRSPGSDNGHYGAHGLALRNEIRTWWCVEKDTVTKNGVIYYTSKREGKRAFNIDKSKPDDCPRFGRGRSCFGTIFSGISAAFQSALIVVATALCSNVLLLIHCPDMMLLIDALSAGYQRRICYNCATLLTLHAM
jgi:hypothetical protein